MENVSDSLVPENFLSSMQKIYPVAEKENVKQILIKIRFFGFLENILSSSRRERHVKNIL